MKFTLEATPHVVALALILAAIAVGIWAYSTRYPVLPGRRRAILLATRLLALLALLVVSLAPVVRYPESSRARNRLLVLVDHSGSMDLRDVARARDLREPSTAEYLDAVAAVDKLGIKEDPKIWELLENALLSKRDARDATEAATA